MNHYLVTFYGTPLDTETRRALATGNRRTETEATAFEPATMEMASHQVIARADTEQDALDQVKSALVGQYRHFRITQVPGTRGAR